MTTNSFTKAYDFGGQTIVITGSGVLGGEMARALFECGANITILDYNHLAAQKLVDSLEQKPGAVRALAAQDNELQTESVQGVVDLVLAEFGKIDGLINAAGGNKPDATTSAEKTFFNLPQEALRWVIEIKVFYTSRGPARPFSAGLMPPSKDSLKENNGADHGYKIFFGDSRFGRHGAQPGAEF
jgi:NAD(P)-dependent dehydrogenase (short-subunit alcohol dehydrogenase family)